MVVQMFELVENEIEEAVSRWDNNEEPTIKGMHLRASELCS